MARVSDWARNFASCAALVALFWSEDASAASAIPLELQWSTPEGDCPAKTALIQQVAQLVERHPTSAYPVRAFAQVERLANDRYRLQLTTESQGARGTRVLEERSCQALSDLVVLILAWMIQPELTVGDDPRQKRAPAEPVSATGPAGARPLQSPGRKTSSWLVSLRGTGDLGSLPKPALGALLGLAYRAAPLQLALQASFFPMSRGDAPRVPGLPATGGNFSLATMALHGCFEPTTARVALCVGPELSREQGRGFGVSSPKTGTKYWLSFSGGLRSALRLGGRFWLEASAEAVVPTLREQFVLDAIGTVHIPAAVSARASLGLGLTL